MDTRTGNRRKCILFSIYYSNRGCIKCKDGYYKYQKDRFGYKIPDTPEEKVEEEDGKDIYLTIDSQIQRFAESAVGYINKYMGIEWTMLAVADAKTGAIHATSTHPSFDPNKRNITNDRETNRNN